MAQKLRRAAIWAHRVTQGYLADASYVSKKHLSPCSLVLHISHGSAFWWMESRSSTCIYPQLLENAFLWMAPTFHMVPPVRGSTVEMMFQNAQLQRLVVCEDGDLLLCCSGSLAMRYHSITAGAVLANVYMFYIFPSRYSHIRLVSTPHPPHNNLVYTNSHVYEVIDDR